MENPSSAIRYSLLSVKPIPFEEIRKIKGHKIKFSGIKYESEIKDNNQFKSIEEFLNFRYLQIFNRMPVPERFDKDTLVKHFMKEALDYNSKYKEIIEKVRRKEKSLLSFIRLEKERFEKNSDQYYEVEASRFLASNLPLTFFSETSMYINTYLKYLCLVERIVRRHETLAVRPGVRHKFAVIEEQNKEMKRVLAPIIDKMDILTCEILSLKFLVCIWSARTMEEVDNPKFIEKEVIDNAYLTEYRAVYNKELKDVRKMLFDLSKTYYPDLFIKQVIQTNPENQMMGKLLLSCVQ